MRNKVLGIETTKDFGGIQVTMKPVPKIVLMKHLARYDLSKSEAVAELGAELAPLCITDIEGVEPTFHNIRVGRLPRRVVSEETFEKIDIGKLAEIMAWVVVEHFPNEEERGN